MRFTIVFLFVSFGLLVLSLSDYFFFSSILSHIFPPMVAGDIPLLVGGGGEGQGIFMI
jgi:hypothetical protein